MATPEEVNNQQQINNLQQQGLNYTERQNQLNRENASISNSLIDDLKEALGLRQRFSQNEEDVLKVNKDINAAINKQKVGLSSVKEVTNQIKKNEDLINKAKATSNSLTRGLTSDQAQLVQQVKAQKLALTQSSIEYENLIASAQAGVVISEEELLAKRIALIEAENLLGISIEQLGVQAQLALLTEEQIAQLEQANNLRQQDLDKLKKIEKAFGFAGSVAKALGELPVVGSAFTQSLAGAQTRVTKIVEETGELPSRMQRAAIFAQEFGSIIQKAALGFLVKQALDLNKGFVQVGRTLGLAKNEIRSLNQDLRDTQAATGNVFTTDKERLAVLNRISETLGMNAKVLGVENVAGAARLEQSLGLAAEAADQLAVYSGITNENVLDTTDNIYSLTNEFNKTNKTAISAKSVLSDVGKTSKTIGALFAFNTKELAAATLEAKKLGLSLDEVNNIAGTLLQFENSITAELEAELFLGRDINLDRARQLALTNDLKGLSKELSDNEAVRQAFASKNRFTIEATAKALGMSVESMSQMFYQSELNRMSAEQFDATYGDQNRKAAEQLAIQENMEKSLARLAEAATPFVELMASLLSHTTTIYGILGAIAGVQLAKLAASFGPVIAKATTLLSIESATAAATTATATAVSAGTLLPIILGSVGAIVGMIAAAQSVKDGIAPSSKGPFTITDSYGATAITAQGDGIAVSPNITQGPPAATVPAATTSAESKEMVQVMRELLAAVKAGGQVVLDGQAVGKAMVMGNYTAGNTV